MCWMPVSNAGLKVAKQLRHPLLCRVCQPLGHGPFVKNGLALAVWYHTPGTTASRPWAGTSFHWAVNTWHCRINIIIVCRRPETMFPCPGSGVNTSYERSKLLLVLGARLECAPQSLKAYIYNIHISCLRSYNLYSLSLFHAICSPKQTICAKNP